MRRVFGSQVRAALVARRFASSSSSSSVSSSEVPSRSADASSSSSSSNTTKNDANPFNAEEFTSQAKSIHERAAAARKEIYEIWNSASEMTDAERTSRVSELLLKYNLNAATPREEDVSRGLGDAFDRLLLLMVPLASASSTQTFEDALHLAARNGRQLSIRTIQHIFSRSSSYAEALAIFYAMRRANVAMNMEAYYAMLYSLQRLEEEGWAERFREELVETGKVTEQALDFVLKGVDNQLLPENKPWLGRIMFADRDEPAQRRTAKDFDEMGELWVKRYRDGGAVPSA